MLRSREDIREVIKSRQSVRTFTGKCPTEEQIEEIQRHIGRKENDYGVLGSVRMVLIENLTNSVIGASHGVIMNATHYIALIGGLTKEDMLNAGYAFERLLLHIESLGLGTCWLASGFQRTASELAKHVNSDEYVIAISPIGEKAPQMSQIDKRSRQAYSSDYRYDFDRLFMDAVTGKAIDNTNLRECLEYVRLAPSGVNFQPWRVAAEAEILHFYIQRENLGSLPYDLQMIDIGIGLYHYSAVTGKETFKFNDPKLKVPTDWEYVVSVS